jgi:DNA-binding GntR family transcriptional regulator
MIQKTSSSIAGGGSRTAASDQVRAMVREFEEQIVLGRIRPRERLVEDDLIDALGAKRHVIRELLAELDRLGLVRRVPNRGSEVRDFSPKEIEDIYELRTLLECEAARRIPSPAPAELVWALKEIQGEHDHAVATGDLGHAFRANRAFHSTLFAACGNAALAEAIEENARRVHGVRFYSLADPRLLERARLEHWAMIHALESGQRNELVSLCQQHLPPSRAAYVAANPAVSRLLAPDNPKGESESQ